MTNDSPKSVADAHDAARFVPDTNALKALAHQDRLRMLALLRIDGPATATGLARRLGLNSGATSYHLRQLARHGFIEAAEDLGNRRERWWRALHRTTVFDAADKTGEALDASLAMGQAIVSQHMELIQRALEASSELPTVWRNASTASDVVVQVTAEEAQALTGRLMEVLHDANTRHLSQDAPLPSGMRHFMVVLHSFPFPDISSPSPDDAAR